MKRPEITPDQVHDSLVKISNEEATFSHFSRLMETDESSLLRDNRFVYVGWGIGEDYGDGDIRLGTKNAVTSHALKGPEERVGRRTFISYGKIALPVDMSKNGIKEFLFEMDSPRDVITHLDLIEETRLLGAIKREFSGFFYRENKELSIGIEGLVKFLNDGKSAFLPSNKIQARIEEAERKVQEFKKENAPTVEGLIAAFERKASV